MSVLDRHFDAVALLEAVHAQPIGLAVSTNHPEGFRRVLYLACRQHERLRCQVLQSPKSKSAFLLVKPTVDINAVVVEHETSTTVETLTEPEEQNE